MLEACFDEVAHLAQIPFNCLFISQCISNESFDAAFAELSQAWQKRSRVLLILLLSEGHVYQAEPYLNKDILATVWSDFLQSCRK